VTGAGVAREVGDFGAPPDVAVLEALFFLLVRRGLVSFTAFVITKIYV
jgi:hypothetical protein